MNDKITIGLTVLMVQWHAMHFYTMLAFVDMLFCRNALQCYLYMCIQTMFGLVMVSVYCNSKCWCIIHKNMGPY